MRKGVSSSEPTAMISAFTGRSVNEKRKVRIQVKRRGSLRQQLQSLNVPGKMMHRVRGGQDHTASGREGESHQSMARHFQVSFALRGDLHNAALAGKGSRHVKVAQRVKRQPLRTSQAAEERVHGPLRIDPMHGVKA